jgi:hypothetical protein
MRRLDNGENGANWKMSKSWMRYEIKGFENFNLGPYFSIVSIFIHGQTLQIN